MTESPSDDVVVVKFTTCDVEEIYLQLDTKDSLNAFRCPAVNALDDLNPRITIEDEAFDRVYGADVGLGVGGDGVGLGVGRCVETIVDTSSTVNDDIDFVLAPMFKLTFPVLALFTLEAAMKLLINEESVSFNVEATESHTLPISVREKRQAAVVLPVSVKFQLSSSS